jgi:hypothetical protein
MRMLRLAGRAAMVGVAACAGMTGCQAGYSADIRNPGPRPVYAQMMEQFDSYATMRSSVRLGPGDRGGLGPVMAREGRAFVVVDTVPSTGTPVRVPLAVGTTILEVTQTGDPASGLLQVQIIGGNPPAAPELPPPPSPGHEGGSMR